MRDDVAVVMPVYNEAQVVGDVIRQVRSVYPKVVCVDDGSSDSSAAVIREAGGRLVAHPTNLGQGAALRTGIEFALLDPTVNYIATFDADGQHDVDDLAPMLALLDSGSVDIVLGSRFLDRRTELSLPKRLLLKAAVQYSRWSTRLRISDSHNGLRVFNREVAAALRLEINGMAHASEILNIVAEAGFSYAEAPVHIRYTDYSRAKGQPLINSINIVFDLIFR